MNSFQARMIMDGKIVGNILIDACPMVATYTIPAFDSLEPLAPFRDKDGGDLYEGDCITSEDCEWGCHFRGTLCYDNLLGWSIETDTEVVADYVNMMHLINITKFGTIHEEG